MDSNMDLNISVHKNWHWVNKFYVSLNLNSENYEFDGDSLGSSFTY